MYYDDNYGEYEIRDHDDVDFFFKVKKESVKKQCAICGRTVRLRPDYDKCDACCRLLERGY